MDRINESATQIGPKEDTDFVFFLTCHFDYYLINFGPFLFTVGESVRKLKPGLQELT